MKGMITGTSKSTAGSIHCGPMGTERKSTRAEVLRKTRKDVGGKTRGKGGERKGVLTTLFLRW